MAQQQDDAFEWCQNNLKNGFPLGKVPWMDSHVRKAPAMILHTSCWLDVINASTWWTKFNVGFMVNGCISRRPQEVNDHVTLWANDLPHPVNKKPDFHFDFMLRWRQQAWKFEMSVSMFEELCPLWTFPFFKYRSFGWAPKIKYWTFFINYNNHFTLGAQDLNQMLLESLRWKSPWFSLLGWMSGVDPRWNWELLWNLGNMGLLSFFTYKDRDWEF